MPTFLKDRCLQYVAIGLIVVAFGCSGSGEHFETAPVSGIVTCGGTPLTAGTIVFSPVSSDKNAISGAPAAGAIGPDGSFTLTTYKEGDGAIVGKHTVSVLPPPPKDDQDNPTIPCSDESVEVEILPGTNDLRIEL